MGFGTHHTKRLVSVGGNWLICLSVMVGVSTPSLTSGAVELQREVQGVVYSDLVGKTLLGNTWVTYTPPSGNPNQGVEANVDAIRGDLDLLRRAKFTGLVTYGSGGSMGKELPRIA